MTNSAFELKRAHAISSLNVELQDFEHRHTGARHLHLAAQDSNNVFLVAFLTVPQDSTGVAHILEHTAAVRQPALPRARPVFRDEPALAEYLYERVY